MKKKPLILWGATGQAIMLEEALRNKFHLKAIFDNNIEINSPFKRISIQHGWTSFVNWKRNIKSNEYYYMIAIGGANGKERIKIHDKIKLEGLNPISAIHQSSYVSSDSILGEGIQVLPNATINPRVKIGKCCIINTSASIDHECEIGDAVHIGPGAKLAGCISIGDYSFIGTNATILPNIKIGKNVIIGAGSVVTKNIPDNVIAFGNPCKVK